MPWFSKGPVIKVNNSAIFTKSELLPNEFGQNAVTHGLKLGMGSYGDYITQTSQSISDHNLRKLVTRNPGFLQLLYSNLVSGGYYGYLKLMLKADENVLAGVALGVREQLKQTMPPVADHVIENHKLIVIQFADAIIREVNNQEAVTDDSATCFLQYALSFYVPSLTADSTFNPIDLRKQVSSMGSRVMAICQDFKLQLVNA